MIWRRCSPTPVSLPWASGEEAGDPGDSAPGPRAPGTCLKPMLAWLVESLVPGSFKRRTNKHNEDGLKWVLPPPPLLSRP